jgi:hypothetical protein
MRNKMCTTDVHNTEGKLTTGVNDTGNNLRRVSTTSVGLHIFHMDSDNTGGKFAIGIYLRICENIWNGDNKKIFVKKKYLSRR